MRKSIMLKVGAVGTTFAMAGALAIAASGTTGAYFSDTKTGDITGTIGSISLADQPLNLTFDRLMPGVAQTVTVPFRNDGSETQDVWLTFTNGPALHALNNLGSYGELHVVANGGAAVFDSANLSDGRTRANGTNSCGAFSTVGCWPLPDKLKVATLAAGASGSATFTFNYASKLGDAGASWDASNGGGVFNTYPSITTPETPGSQAFGADAGGTPGAGLPFNVVAVQVGQQP